MRLLDNREIYSNTAACLRYAKEYYPDCRDEDFRREPVTFHAYWYGIFGAKQNLSVKSCLVTQKYKIPKIILWLDKECGYDGHPDNPYIKELLPYVEIRKYDPKSEAINTIYENEPLVDKKDNLAVRSDFFRCLILYKYGGLYFDLDVIFLRDILPLSKDEFIYQWSYLNAANSAVLYLKQYSQTASSISRELLKCEKSGQFKYDTPLDIMVYPSAFFDPLWLINDKKDLNLIYNDLRHFPDFFKKTKNIICLNDFFDGAFAYHWHNCWDIRAHEKSYFSQLKKDIEAGMDRFLISGMPVIKKASNR